jgi:hypothetical protein
MEKLNKIEHDERMSNYFIKNKKIKKQIITTTMKARTTYSPMHSNYMQENMKISHPYFAPGVH